MAHDFSQFTAQPVPYEGYVSLPKSKNLILDLDSTLVYTFLQRPEGCTDDPERWLVNTHEEPDGTQREYCTLIRPYAKTFVERCSEHYNIFFLTAGDRLYAEPVLSKLFPHIPPKRRFYRDSCAENEHGLLLKDLELLGFDLRVTILLDDFAPENTIPMENGMYCSQFVPRGGENDTSLESVEALMADTALEEYCKLLCGDFFLPANDVRKPLKMFRDLMNQNLSKNERDSIR